MTGPSDEFLGRRRRWGRADQAVRVGPRSAVVLTLASVAGLMMFVWPLLVRVEPQSMQHGPDAPFVFVGILPVLIVIVLAELSEGGLDSKALAMLGVLSAVNAALRPLGAGTAGIETVFFMLVLSGRVFGAGFGFVLGCTSLFASALLTAGVGPWLPFQMLSSAWIGMGAGLLPRRVSGRAEIAMLVAYGIVVAYLFGFLMNLWFWPFITDAEVPYHDGHISYVPGDPVSENLHRFAVFTLLTSTAGWDTGRAITNTVAILVIGPAVLATLRRASRRASYGTTPTFADPPARFQRAGGARDRNAGGPPSPTPRPAEQEAPMPQEPTDPTVRAFVAAINDGDRPAFDAVLAPGASMSDDGTERDLESWVDKEIFSADGRMTVESEQDGGLSLVAAFTNSTWGSMRTRWRFTVENGRVTRFDTGQA